MIVRCSIEIKEKNKALRKIRAIKSKITSPNYSNDILKKLRISNFMTPKYIRLEELTKKHHTELLESTHTMIKIFFTQIENFSNAFYKVVDNHNRRITKHALKIQIALLSDTINSIKSFSTYNDSTQYIFDIAISKLYNNLNKLIEIPNSKNMHSLSPVKGKIKCELKEILSEMIFISKSTKKEIDKCKNTTNTEL